jgi:23S rRNA (cytosine1962-C5)-methyltransferase
LTPFPEPVFEFFTPGPWADYVLLDSGGMEKLERFGPYTVRRPEPQAIWPKTLSSIEWDTLADATFKKADKKDVGEEKGMWSRKPDVAERWMIAYSLPKILDEKVPQIRFRISLSSFKHVGIFPEQAPNWDFIYEQGLALPADHQVLNLFAYTGGASLAAAHAGGRVTHVDSIKPTLSWARENMEETGLTGIRWMAEDALAFAQREVRRGRVYQGIILDPPAYGRGPDGERWLLEEGINPLMEACRALLDPEQGYLILNLYSLGYSPIIASRLGMQYAPHGIGDRITRQEFGELCVGQGNARMPLGTCYRLAWG